ncbi:MAG: T9SS type A sorting domain-containing protein [Flavobacteriales bacterium]|nr:T9SS type A sorting domain-containing protein [Flavobacteriales bacterium]
MGTNLVWVRDTVFISGCWFQGNLQSPKSFTDTFNIGKLNTGFYFINFTAQDYHYLDSCTNNRSITKIRIFKVGSLDHKESKEKTNFRLFPNPTNSSFTLTTQNNTDHKSIEICNAQGQLLLKEDFDGDTYQFKGELNTGIYLIKLSDQRRAYHQKLVVQ